MAYYELSKSERAAKAKHIHAGLEKAFLHNDILQIQTSFSDEDTFLRKVAYIATGRIYSQASTQNQRLLLATLLMLFQFDEPKIRQTCINAAGEIGIKQFEAVEELMHKGLRDEHHMVRNAVIGSIKKMGQKNPGPVFAFARLYLHHPDKEIRREICHGIELRGRTHPEDCLPLLKELQFDTTRRVRTTLVHVLGQIAYKKGCLVTVVAALNTWENKELVKDALHEIIDVHQRYKNFSALTQAEATEYIARHALV